jgi:class 3 adenylate cyclase
MDWEFTPGVAKIKEGLVNTMLVSAKVVRNPIRDVLNLFSAGDIQQQPTRETRHPTPAEPKMLDTSVVPLLISTESVDVAPSKTVSAQVEQRLKPIEHVQILPCPIIESEQQNNYRVFYVESHLRSILNGLKLTITLYLVVNIIFISAFVITGREHGSSLQVSLRILCMVGMLLLVFIFRRFRRSLWLHWATISLYTFSSVVSVLMLYTIQSKFVYTIVLEIMYTNVIYNHVSGIPFKYIVVGCLCILTPWVCIASTVGFGSSTALETTLFVMFFMVLNGAASYSRERQNRKTYILNRMQDEERLKTQELLMKMMPKQVYDAWQTQLDPATSDTYERTTVLYADICGFTIWAKNKSPREVVGMLSRLYKSFDNLTVKHNVYKVHTIGDCYVVLGLNDCTSSTRDYHFECTNVVNMSIDMVRVIKGLNEEVENLNIGMRIGIHTGKVTGGFAGTIVVRYDIYGASVAKANKMESGGSKNRINVSYKTKALLSEACPDRFDYEPNEKELVYEPRNKLIPAFYLVPRGPEDSF